MGDLAEIIERLQRATGPDRELDARIQCAIQGFKFIAFDDSRGCDSIKYEGPSNALDLVYDYTGSFDAAWMLIPAGLYWHASEGKTRADEPLGAASIIAPVSLETIAEAEHASVVIALCIVALKARAAS